MKKIFILYLLIKTFFVFSQNRIIDILNTNNVDSVLISIKNQNRVKYILGSNPFEKIKKGYVLDIYLKKEKKSGFSLFPLNLGNQFCIYTLMSTSEINIDINTFDPIAVGLFIIYDTKNRNIFYLECLEPSGTLLKTDKNTIKIKYITTGLSNKIFKLDNNLIPVNSLESIKNNDSILYEISTYQLNENQFIKKSIINKGFEANSNNIKYEELTFLLNSIGLKFDKIEKCNNFYCDCKISRFFIKNPKK